MNPMLYESVEVMKGKRGTPPKGSVGTVNQVHADGTFGVEFAQDEAWADKDWRFEANEIKALGECARCGRRISACLRVDEFCVKAAWQ